MMGKKEVILIVIMSLFRLRRIPFASPQGPLGGKPRDDNDNSTRTLFKDNRCDKMESDYDTTHGSYSELLCGTSNNRGKNHWPVDAAPACPGLTLS